MRGRLEQQGAQRFAHVEDRPRQEAPLGRAGRSTRSGPARNSRANSPTGPRAAPLDSGESATTADDSRFALSRPQVDRPEARPGTGLVTSAGPRSAAPVITLGIGIDAKNRFTLVCFSITR
jgi:hypothetical protein